MVATAAVICGGVALGGAVLVGALGQRTLAVALGALGIVLTPPAAGLLILSLARRLERIERSSAKVSTTVSKIEARQSRDSVRIRNTASSLGRLAPDLRRAMVDAAARPVATVGPQALAGEQKTLSDVAARYKKYKRPWEPNVARDLRVAVILDEFSTAAFAPEWHQVPLKPDEWAQQLAAADVDLLFVESAWRGNGGAWRYHLIGPSAPRPALVELLKYCRAHQIPTVFWNKEDPAHKDGFIQTAQLFDWVFTTDVDLLDWYRTQLGHQRVGVLQFAAQPQMHNPIRNGLSRHERDVAFAGSYFAERHESRREQMELLLGAAIDVTPKMDRGLEIFSRQLGGDQRYQFPEPYASRVVGSLDYDRMLTAYRDYKVFLNVNSVVGSPTMCARRIFEIVAAGTPVVSTPSPAISEIFPADEVPQVSSREEARFVLRSLVRNPDVRDRMVHDAQRRIWASHTYGHRVDQVLETIGLNAHLRGGPARQVSVLAPTNRPEQLDHILSTMAQQRDVELQLVLLTHGFEAEESVRTAAAERGITDLVVLTADPSVPLGECMNILARAADGGVVAKMDDDDHYGPYYLRDQLNALWYSGAAVVGKQARYMYLEGSDVTVLRFPHQEHKFLEQVSGPTLVMARDLVLEAEFPPLPRGSDTGFLGRVVGGGGKVYSADRFNFVQVRRTDPNAHTWAITDAELLATSTVTYPGRGFAHASF